MKKKLRVGGDEQNQRGAKNLLNIDDLAPVKEYAKDRQAYSQKGGVEGSGGKSPG